MRNAPCSAADVGQATASVSVLRAAEEAGRVATSARAG